MVEFATDFVKASRYVYNWPVWTAAVVCREVGRLACEVYQLSIEEKSMEYRQLGRSGLQVSAVGLGTNTYGRYTDEAGTVAILHHALEVGINFIDGSNTYGRGVSETHIGKAIQGHRRDYVLSTKVGGAMGDGPYMQGNSRRHIMESVEDSLRRLQTDYIDLYQIHFVDPKTPIEETMRTLDDLVRQGKVRYIGCSNFAAWQISEANWTAKAGGLTQFVSVQPQYNLLQRSIDHELVPYCAANGVGIIPFSPLAGGFLTGKYRRGEPVPEGTRGFNNRGFERTLTDRNFSVVEKLETFSQERGHAVGELAIAWLLARPMVSTVITGTTNPGQVEENARAAEWRLTPEEMAGIDKIVSARDETSRA